MIIAIYPLIVALIGVLLYALSSNSKLVRIGEILFFVGILWTVYGVAGKVMKLG